MLTAVPSRREFLFNGGMGLGTVALSAMLNAEPHHPAKAKH